MKPVKYNRSPALALMAAILGTTLVTPSFATEQAQQRREGRDIKQDTRQDSRQEKVDCRAENQKSNAACRQDKRENKSEGRQQARDIKY
jgi:hypothetical protein